MANWTTRITTTKGKALDAKVLAGACKLKLTKMKTGNGSPENIETLTDLKSPQQVVPISSVTTSDAGTADIEGVMTNVGLERGYFFKEWGLFAEDPDEGEILYMVLIDANPDYFQAEGTATALSLELHLTIGIKDADSVTAVLNPKGLLTLDDLAHHDASPDAHAPAISKALKGHDESDAAHENRFKLFEKIATLGDDIIKKLALTTAITAITALETGSWFGQLLKMVLTASGVKYNIAQNGYVCLGSFFGGLIIQWGIFQIINGSGSFTLPLSSTMLNGYIQHYGVSAQYNGLSGTMVTSSLNKEPETLAFLAICK